MDRHYAACVKSAEKLKTESGKEKRYLRNFQDLLPYFVGLSEETFDYINHKWKEKVPSEK